jgi:hypothetical protein
MGASFMIASIVYIPPPTFKGARTFVENLKKCPPTHKLIVMSDHDYKADFPTADYTFLKARPEDLAARTANPTCGISNALFVAAMRDAHKRGVKHLIYLESDCRVGQAHWDATVFDEYFQIGFPVVAAGTLMAWNVFNGGKAWVKSYQAMGQRSIDFPTPIHSYGIFPMENKTFNPTIFPNGAGMVINVAWAWELFNGFDNLMAIATGEGMEGKAFDWQIGERVRKKFGDQTPELFHHLRSVCSCYGDLAMTEDERLDLLRAGQIAISHQHKGDKTV